jgi:Ca-activated chloride channel homolog
MIRISSLRIVTWCCTASLAVATSHAGAQTRPVALLAQVDGELKPLEVRSAAIDVHVEGPHALTTTTLVFGNPFNRVLEGEAVFPLQTGSAISGFGLDVDGEIVDAVAVERHAARKAFESEVRRAVDPGLVEWVSGNVFRTRVFPIPALSSRTVRVRYSSELSVEGD